MPEWAPSLFTALTVAIPALGYVALFAQDAATPTTIVGAFIFVCLSVVGLLGWLVRHLLTVTLPEQQRTFTAGLADVVKSWSGATDRLAADSTRRHEGIMKELERLLDFLQAWNTTGLENQQLLKALVQVTERRTRLADVVMSARDAIYTKTLEGVVTSWNAACERLLGWKAAEVLGQSIRKVIPADRHDEEDGLLRRVRSGEEVAELETERLHKDGRRVAVLLTVSPISQHGASGRVIGASVIAREA